MQSKIICPLKKNVCVVYYLFIVFLYLLYLWILWFLCILLVSEWDVLKSPTVGLSISPWSSDSCWFLCFEGIFLGVSHKSAHIRAPTTYLMPLLLALSCQVEMLLKLPDTSSWKNIFQRIKKNLKRLSSCVKLQKKDQFRHLCLFSSIWLWFYHL